MKARKSFLSPTYELELLELGYDAVIGIDEAGRGPWAGPVSIAAYIFTKRTKIIDGIHDSKKLDKKERQSRFDDIETLEDEFKYMHELVTSEKIDELGIGIVIENSIQNLMNKAHEGLKGLNLFFLIDGYFKRKFDSNYELIKAGDSKFYTIAAASIVAKYKRDLIMQKFALEYPEYGFDQHVGYGTKFHRVMLEKYGPSPIHRMSYKPVAEIAKHCA